MRILKELFKIILTLLLLLVLLVLGYALYSNVKPMLDARRDLKDISTYARPADDLVIGDQVRVIGLGEATHGNKEFQELKLTVLKSLVEKQNVRAFGMEMDYAEGVIVDSYICGSSDMDLTEVMDHVSFGIYQTVQIRELIEWMKSYNEQHPEELLHFYGFDLQNPDQDLYVITGYLKEHEILSDFNLTDSMDSYLRDEYSLRDQADHHLLDDLQVVEDELTNSAALYQDTEGYRQVLGCITNVKWACELSQVGNDSVAYGTYRDSHMALRVQEIADYESARGSRLMITGHNGHVGYMGSFVKTMGSYLRDAIGDEYTVVGTDYYKTKCNINAGSSRKNYHFWSGDILAYQAKELGTYYLNFSDVPESSDVYPCIYSPINTGSLGESYSVLNHLIPATVRIHCEANLLYDGMILVYDATPLQFNR